MNRRLFLGSSVVAGCGFLAAKSALALPAQRVTVPSALTVKPTSKPTPKPVAHTPAQPTPAAAEVCVMRLDEITADSTGFSRYEHYHVLALPLAVLITPPAEGFKIRCSPLDPASLDLEAIDQFLKETGLDESLKQHSHEVSFTQADLNLIATGQERVKIAVLSPKGNPAHEFFFTAPASAVIKIKRAREARG